MSISVLLYKQAETYLVLRRFTYKNAFKHQKIDDEANWEVENEQIPLTVDLANLFQQKEQKAREIVLDQLKVPVKVYSVELWDQENN